MTDTPWRDAYDDPEGMACALDQVEAYLARHGRYPEATTANNAAACIREQAGRIAELEAQPTPAPKQDRRPEECRFRAQEEGRPYPRSSCRACGKTIATGLGNRCTFVTPAPEQEGRDEEHARRYADARNAAWNLARQVTEAAECGWIPSGSVLTRQAEMVRERFRALTPERPEGETEHG